MRDRKHFLAALLARWHRGRLVAARERLEDAEYEWNLWGRHIGLSPSEKRALRGKVDYWHRKIGHHSSRIKALTGEI